MTIYVKNGNAVIDEGDYTLVKPFNWYIDVNGYVIAWLPDSRSFLRMHNFILGYHGPLDIDHINRVRHDNRRENLRIVEHYINLHNAKIRTDNTNGFKGIFLNRSGNWGYQAWIEGKKYTKQGFHSKEQAYEARVNFLIDKGVI